MPMDKETKKYLDGKFGAIDKRFDAVDAKFEAVDERFESMEALVGSGFDDVYKRLDRADAQFGILVDEIRLLRADVKDSTTNTRSYLGMFVAHEKDIQRIKETIRLADAVID